MKGRAGFMRDFVMPSGVLGDVRVSAVCRASRISCQSLLSEFDALSYLLFSGALYVGFEIVVL